MEDSLFMVWIAGMPTVFSIPFDVFSVRVKKIEDRLQKHLAEVNVSSVMFV